MPTISLIINGFGPVDVLVDCGATCTLVSSKLAHPQIPWSGSGFLTVGGVVSPEGSAEVKLTYNGSVFSILAAIYENFPFPMILGIDGMRMLGLEIRLDDDKNYIALEKDVPTKTPIVSNALVCNNEELPSSILINDVSPTVPESIHDFPLTQQLES